AAVRHARARVDARGPAHRLARRARGYVRDVVGRDVARGDVARGAVAGRGHVLGVGLRPVGGGHVGRGVGRDVGRRVADGPVGLRVTARVGGDVGAGNVVGAGRRADDRVVVAADRGRLRDE